MSKIIQYKDYDKNIILCKEMHEIHPYYVALPDAPKLEKFKNYGKPVLEQFYHRDRIPDKLLKLNRLDREEAFKIAAKDKECADFISQAWDKRINGEWVLIGGRPTYIPPTYYFYLNWYHLDDGRPDFRENDLNSFYFYDLFVVPNGRIYGEIELSRRRSGKSFRAGCKLLNYVTRHPASFCGMQSKTENDAQSLFYKAVVLPFRKLPWFFKPMYDKTGKMKNEILFTTNGDNEDEFNSWIDYRASTDTAYDGEKLHRGLIDEAGKMKPPTDPVKMWDKMKPCLLEDDRVIGKVTMTTTVELMEKGGLQKYLEVWMDSSRRPDDNKVNELGETISGLVPYFMPAHECYLWDRFGFSIVDDPKDYQVNDLKKQYADRPSDISKGLHKMGAKELLDLKFRSIKDANKRQDEIRKFPRTVTEAFASSATGCHFNLGIINDRLGDFLFEPEKYKVRGNFEWENGERFGNVVFRAKANGNWLISYMPPQDKSNQWAMVGSKKKPMMTDKFVMGLDAFKYNITTAGRPSLGSMYIWMFYDHSLDGEKENEGEWISDDFVAEYLGRPATIDMLAEDALKACIYYGCKVNPENNAGNVWSFYEQWGFGAFLHYNKKLKKDGGRVVVEESKTPGATTLGNAVKDAMFANTDWYIETHGYRCKFPNYLTACRDVTYDNLSPFDCFVGGAYTLMPVREMKSKAKEAVKSFSSFLPTKKY